MGGCVNNMATGKINCGQAAGLRGVFVRAKGALGGKRPVICEAERKLVRAGWRLPFNSETRGNEGRKKREKASRKEDIGISRQKIVDIPERLILLIFIVLMCVCACVKRSQNTLEDKSFFVFFYI